MKLLNTPAGHEIRGENRNALFHVFRTISSLRAARERICLGERDAGNPWFGAEKIDVAGFEEVIIDCFVDKVLCPSDNTTVTGFKEINHLPDDMSEDEFERYVRFILDSFPAARIIFNTRNAGQVANSGWFKDMNRPHVIDQIETADRRFHSCAERNHNCFVIDHSDLLNRTPRLHEMLDWLDLEITDSALNDILNVKLTHMQSRNLVSRVRRWMRPALGKALRLIPRF